MARERSQPQVNVRLTRNAAALPQRRLTARGERRRLGPIEMCAQGWALLDLRDQGRSQK
jgi:hypothetical protein